MGRSEVDVNLLLTILAALVIVACLLFSASFIANRHNQRVVSYVCQVAALSASWWGISVSLVMTDRFFLGLTDSFSYPITLTELHTAIKGTIAAIILLVQTNPDPGTRGGTLENGGSEHEHERPQSHSQHVGCFTARVLEVFRLQRITRRTVLLFLLPMGICTGIDVWSSKFGLQHLDVSVYTIIKSCALIFTFIFSLLLRLQSFSWTALSCTVGITVGVMLSTVKSSPVDASGVIVTLIGSACSAARWVLTERYFGRRAVKPSAVAVLALQAPFTFAVLMPWWITEMPSLSKLAVIPNGLSVFAGLSLGGGCLAFCLLFVEAKLVSITSALSMNIIGQMKDIAAVTLAVMAFHEALSPHNIVGTVLAILCALWFSIFKARKYEAIPYTLVAAEPQTRATGAMPPTLSDTAIDFDAVDSDDDSGEEEEKVLRAIDSNSSSRSQDLASSSAIHSNTDGNVITQRLSVSDRSDGLELMSKSSPKLIERRNSIQVSTDAFKP